MVEVGKKYALLRTDIAIGKGINGVDFLSYEDAEILSIEGDIVKFAYAFRLMKSPYKVLEWAITYVPLSHIVMWVPKQTRKEYWIQRTKSHATYSAELTEEELAYNRAKGIVVTKKESRNGC